MESRKIEFAAKALILNDGKYLALHKSIAKHNLYELPGGRMEFGETAEETLIREVKEETNLIVEPIKLLDTWNFIAKDYQVTGIIYLCKIKEGSLTLSDEHDKYEWLEFNKQSISRMHDVYKERMVSWNMKEIEGRKNKMKDKIEKLIANFQLRNIEVICFDTIESAKNEILNLVPINESVGIGHSATLQKMDITKTLNDRGNTVFDKELAKDKEACKALKKKALLADCYISGSNAISVDGRIVNVDHSGNRVAAITFGPDNVIIVVGVNKIVDTWEEAIKRVKNVSCPLNAKRAGFNPPCVKLNKCVDCSSTERVCNSISIIEGQSVKGRIRVFIINEDLGF